MSQPPPTRPLFRYWRRTLDLRLYEYVGITCIEFRFKAKTWWLLWRAGWDAQEVALLLSGWMMGEVNTQRRNGGGAVIQSR